MQRSVDEMKRLGSIVAILILCSMTGIVFPIGNIAGLDGKETNLGNTDIRLMGNASDDRFGISVAIFGDVNDDGFADYGVLAGLSNQSSSIAQPGALYIYFGNGTGYTGDLLSDDADVIIWGNQAVGSSGTTTYGLDVIDYIGDLNGDGLEDIAIGAMNHVSSAGAVYVFFGRGAWNKTYTTDDADSIWNNTSGNFAGSDVSGAGDINSDGYDELLVGAIWAGTGTDGMCFLIMGRPTNLWPNYANLTDDSNASWVAESTWIDLGYNAAAGDVNGDGYDDFLLGARLETDSGSSITTAGKAYLFFGNATPNYGTNVSAGNASVWFWGEVAGAEAGEVFDGVGDVNGDGYDDIVFGNYLDASNGTDSGRAYLWLGHSGTWHDNNTLANSSVTFFSSGADAGNDDLFGRSVARIGDVNGDGLDDIFIGSPWNDTTDTDAGQAYLFLGRSTWNANYSASKADITYLGEGASDSAGWSVGGGSDVNGDGLDDIIIGAPWNSSVDRSPDNGKAYLIHPEDNIEPATVTSVTAYTDGTYTVVAPDTKMNNIVFVQLVGTDGDPGRANFATVIVKSNGTDPTGIPVMCKETGVNTGIYRGNFTVRSSSSVFTREIGASVSELVNGSAKNDPAKKFSLQVRGVQLFPTIDTDIAIDGAFYKTPYWAVSTEGAPVWSFTTNASWLNWGAGNHTVYGTPAIVNIGKTYWVNLSTTAGSYSDLHNFTIVVWGATPALTVAHAPMATEDVYYSKDYNTDHDALMMNYTMDIVSPWLTLNKTTGLLNGTPTNAHVSQVFINMTVNYPWCIAALHTPFNITVANVAPSITTTDITSVLQDQNYNVDYNSTDDGQGTVTWSIKTNATWLSHVNSVISGKPKYNQVGDFYVNMTVNDGNGGIDFHNFTLTVVNVNDAPGIISTPTTDAYVEENYTYTVLGRDLDPSDVLSYTLITKPDNMTIGPVNGTISWRPSPSQTGLQNVKVVVTDLASATGEQSYTILVTDRRPPANQPPNLLPIGAQTIHVGEKLTIPCVAIDVDHDALTWSLTGHPAGMAINSTGVITWTPTAADLGTYQFAVRVTDGKSAPVEKNVTVTVEPAPIPPNNKPVIDNIGVLSVEEGAIFTYTVKATDADNDTLQYHLDSAPAGMTIDPASGQVQWQTSGTDIGEHTVVAQVSDGKDNVTITFYVRVTSKPPPPNNPPVVATQADITVEVGKPMKVTLTATDKDGDTLTYTLLTTTLIGMAVDDDGVVTWTPRLTDIGSWPVQVRVSDGKGGNTIVSFNVTVKKTPPVEENRAPTIKPVADMKVEAGKPMTIKVEATDLDLYDQGKLVLSLIWAPNGMSIAQDGTITWTPTDADVGPHVINVQVIDTKGNTGSASFNVTVDPASTGGGGGDDGGTSGQGNGSMMPFLLILVVLVVVAVLVMVVMRRKQNGPEALAPQQPQQSPLPLVQPMPPNQQLPPQQQFQQPGPYAQPQPQPQAQDMYVADYQQQGQSDTTTYSYVEPVAQAQGDSGNASGDTEPVPPAQQDQV